MIQELLGSGLISGERRINPITTNGTILQPPPTTYSYHNSSPSSSSSTTTTPTTTTTSTTLAGAISGTGTAHHHSLTNSSTLASSSSSLGAAAAGGGGGGGEHLRCPRCDSSNTKFCYYNNYNLTQPRHFCKTCRRYWTKGGALRNVPIGGGCRKNKSTSGGLITSSSSSSVVLGSTFGKPTPTTANNKLKSLAVDFGSSSSSSSPSLFGASLYDLHHLQHNHHHHHQDLPSNSPILWASPQTNNSHHHHFLSLLRSSPPNPQNPNPNPSSTTSTLSPPPTSSSVKDELANSSIGSLFGTTSHHMKMFEPQMPARTLGGWDTSSVNSHDQAPNFLGLNYPPIPIWKGDSNGNGYLVGSCDEPHDHHNDNVGMQEVYQRLKASTGGSSYDVFNDDNNNVGTTSSSSTVAPVAGGGGGFVGYSWNPAAFTSSTATTTTGAASWSDLPTTANNGTAYP